MAVNKELLQLTLKTIKETPQHWEQSQWHCGTTHCFAGIAELLYKNMPIDTHTADLFENEYFYDQNGYIPNTRKNAIKILGITRKDSVFLFYLRNTLEDLEIYVSELCEHETILTDRHSTP